MIEVCKWTNARRYVSKRLRREAKDKPCVLCGADDGTTVPAHLPGSFYGMPAGGAQKTHDWLVADLCVKCHAYVDGPKGRKDAQLRMMALCRTLERRFEDGVLSSVG